MGSETMQVPYAKLDEWAKTMRDATKEIKARNARIAAIEATELELRDAVWLLARELVAYDRGYCSSRSHIDAEVLANPIAAEAVRKAGSDGNV